MNKKQPKPTIRKSRTVQTSKKSLPVQTKVIKAWLYDFNDGAKPMIMFKIPSKKETEDAKGYGVTLHSCLISYQKPINK